jgi:hypothetical protein
MTEVVVAWYGMLSRLVQGPILALRTSGGWAFPGLFAIGGALPLLAVAAIVGGGLAVTERVVGRLARAERTLRKGAGVVLVLAGAHDTVVYWLL